LARDGGHLRVRVDATRRDTGVPERREKLAAAAAEIDHTGGAGEDRRVLAQPPLDALAGPSKLPASSRSRSNRSASVRHADSMLCPRLRGRKMPRAVRH